MVLTSSLASLSGGATGSFTKRCAALCASAAWHTIPRSQPLGISHARNAGSVAGWKDRRLMMTVGSRSLTTGPKVTSPKVSVAGIGRASSQSVGRLNADGDVPVEDDGSEDSEKPHGRPMYFDNQATTPVDPRVLDKMLPLFVDVFGNPHSRTHAYGWEAEDLVEEAREHVAKLIGCQSKREIIFTSGATESNNMAIKGAAEFYGAQNPQKRHIITTQIEHKCVLASCRHLQNLGWDVTYLPVKQDGLICLTEFEKAIRPGETVLASIMYVNNEIGVVQPIEEIVKICKKNKVLFHTDAAQAVGRLPLDVDKIGIDLMSISGHKLYGPKGVGALYVRGKPRVRLSPILSGGGQERGFRSGTLPAPIIVGFGEACHIAQEEMENDKKHITFLADRLYNGITSQLPDVTLNGSKLHRYHGNLNLSFAFVEGESLLMSLPNIAISSGSACTSASLEPSYVLRAIGVDEELAHTSLRFGIGRFTTVEEVDEAVQKVVEHVARLREMSPLYEMAHDKDGPTAFVWT